MQLFSIVSHFFFISEKSSRVTIENLLQVAMRSIARKVSSAFCVYEKHFALDGQYFFSFLQHDTFDVPNGYLESDLLVNPVTLSQIIGNVENGTYANTDEYLHDFKWLHHNINILAGGDSSGKVTQLLFADANMLLKR